MSKSKHTEAHLISALKQMEAGRKAEDVAREYGVSKQANGSSQQLDSDDRRGFSSWCGRLRNTYAVSEAPLEVSLTADALGNSVTGVTAGILGEEVDVYPFGSQMSIQDVAHQVKFVPAMDYKSVSRLTAINSTQASYEQRFIEAALVAYPEKSQPRIRGHHRFTFRQYCS